MAILNHREGSIPPEKRLLREGSVEQGEVDRIVAEIETSGYFVIPSVIDPRQADEVRETLEDLLRREAPRGSTTQSQRVTRIAVKHPIFLDCVDLP